MTTKYKIAKIISGGWCPFENPTYEQLLESIYENQYRTLNKVPTEMILLGTVKSFIITDLEHANRVLKIVKKVIKESLEVTGIELTFVDDEWEKLILIGKHSIYHNINGYRLSIDGINEYKGKGYLGEFFLRFNL